MMINKAHKDIEDGVADSGRHSVDLPKVILSEVLFSGQRELTIQHMGQVYRLRQTQQGKLILTK
jgi:hemin uptake protein HemP